MVHPFQRYNKSSNIVSRLIPDYQHCGFPRSLDPDAPPDLLETKCQESNLNIFQSLAALSFNSGVVDVPQKQTRRLSVFRRSQTPTWVISDTLGLLCGENVRFGAFLVPVLTCRWQRIRTRVFNFISRVRASPALVVSAPGRWVRTSSAVCLCWETGNGGEHRPKR